MGQLLFGMKRKQQETYGEHGPLISLRAKTIQNRIQACILSLRLCHKGTPQSFGVGGQQWIQCI